MLFLGPFGAIDFGRVSDALICGAFSLNSSVRTFWQTTAFKVPERQAAP
jgi:hypothetical protein